MSSDPESRDAIAASLDPRPLLVPLGADVQVALDLLKVEAYSAFARRAYVRSLGVLIEAWMYAIKQVCLRAAGIAIERFTDAELALLREVSYELNDKGVAYEAAKFLPVEKNFKFVYMAYSKLMGADLPLELSDEGWPAFRQLTSIRNRLTHPKSAQDLVVSDAEIQAAERAGDWFMSVTTQLWAHAEQTYKLKRRTRQS